jgi:hypothetical protein
MSTLLTAKSMPPSAAAFSAAFESALKREASSAPFTEVEQFRAMMRAFSSLKPQYYLEEFHGFSRQVYFNTSHSWMRARARCELCDVLFVTYATNIGFSVRMSLLQAKLSHDRHATNLTSHLGQIEPQSFQGNFEQWDLLRRRPTLDPTTVFVPPPDLLASAVLPSVGTFGIFFRDNAGMVDLFYVSADSIAAQATPAGPDARRGKLRTVTGPAARKIGGWSEATYCSSSGAFGASLFCLEIGTPILEVSSGGGRREHQPQLDWVRSVIATHISRTEGNAAAARVLLADLGPTDPLPFGAEVPSLVVLQGQEGRTG